MNDRMDKSDLFDILARVGKALGSGKRLELLDLLVQGERSVEQLARAAGLGLTTASAHLGTLKAAGLVATRREGPRVVYRLAGQDVAELYALACRVATERTPGAGTARRTHLGPPDTEAIDQAELIRRVAAGEAMVVDVRPVEEYAAGHIPGAVSVPLDQLEEHLASLPADVEIVAYCRGEHCVLAHDAVRTLTGHGRPARRLDQGMLEWRLANLPVETARAAA